MYGRLGAAAVGSGAASLPVTGFSIGWMVVAAVTVLLAGVVLIRLAPRRRQRRAR